MKYLSRLLAALALVLTAALCVAPRLAMAAPQFMTVVASRAALGAYTSSVAGAVQNAFVTESGHAGMYVYNSGSTATPDGNSVIAPSDNPATGRWLATLTQLSGHLNFTMCASGCNFTDLVSAQSTLESFGAAVGTEIVMTEPCGQLINYNNTPFYSRAHGMIRWTVQGCPPVHYPFTSVVSTSGTPGNYSIILQSSSSVSAIVPNHDYVVINDASGGANPTALDGDCKVTAINAGSNQVTLNCWGQYPASDLPSGSVVGTMRDMSSVFSFTNMSSTVAAMGVWEFSYMIIQNIVIACDGTCPIGLSIQDNSHVLSQGILVVDDAAEGMYNNYASTMDFDNTSADEGLYVSRAKGAFGVLFQTGAAAEISPIIVTGGAGVGIEVDGGGSFLMGSSTTGTVGNAAIGNAGDGIVCQNGASVEWTAGASDYNGYAAGVPAAGYGFDSKQMCSAMATTAASAVGNYSGASYPYSTSASVPNLNGFVVTSNKGCYGDDLQGCISRSNGSPLEVQSANGVWINSGSVGTDIDSAYTNPGSGQLNVKSGYKLGGTLLFSSSTPSISSGFGSSPSIVASNGTAAFSVNVGTGGSSSTGIIAFAVGAAHGWACNANDITSANTVVTNESGSTTTTVSFASYSRSSGAPVPWNSDDLLTVTCVPY